MSCLLHFVKNNSDVSLNFSRHNFEVLQSIVCRHRVRFVRSRSRAVADHGWYLRQLHNTLVLPCTIMHPSQHTAVIKHLQCTK